MIHMINLWLRDLRKPVIELFSIQTIYSVEIFAVNVENTVFFRFISLNVQKRFVQNWNTSPIEFIGFKANQTCAAHIMNIIDTK